MAKVDIDIDISKRTAFHEHPDGCNLRDDTIASLHSTRFDALERLHTKRTTPEHATSKGQINEEVPDHHSIKTPSNRDTHSAPTGAADTQQAKATEHRQSADGQSKRESVLRLVRSDARTALHRTATKHVRAQETTTSKRVLAVPNPVLRS